jgi:4'-phosphopantetheinyl transferase EntD
MALMQQDRALRFSLFSDSEMALLEPEQILHPVEREMYKTMSISRKADFLKGRYAVKSILNDSPASQMSHVLIAAASSGKPYAPSDPKLFCSISHSDGYAAAAISMQAAIGIDVEKIKARHPALLRYISDDDLGDLAQQYSRDIFPIVVWTIKEAAAKADTNIFPLREYRIFYKKGITVKRGDNYWNVTLVVLPFHICAIAIAQ